MKLSFLIIVFGIVSTVHSSLAQNQESVQFNILSEDYQILVGTESLTDLNIYKDQENRPITIQLSSCQASQITYKKDGMRPEFAVLRASINPRGRKESNCKNWKFQDSYVLEASGIPAYNFSESSLHFALDTFVFQHRGVHIDLDAYGTSQTIKLRDTLKFEAHLGASPAEYYGTEVFSNAAQSEIESSSVDDESKLHLKARLTHITHIRNNRYDILSDEVIVKINWQVMSPEGRSIFGANTSGECKGILDGAFDQPSKEMAIAEAVKNSLHDFLVSNETKLQEIYAQRDWEILQLTSPNSQIVDLESALNSIVSVNCGDNALSGVFINSEGVILTDSYVLPNDSSEVTVITMDQKEHTAKILRKRPELSLMVIQIDVESPYFMTLPTEKDYDLAEKVYAISNPDPQLGQSLSMGIISGNRTIEGVDYVQSDVKISPSSFGGVLVNSDGTKLYGLLSDKRVGKGVSGLVFSISAETIGPLLRIK